MQEKDIVNDVLSMTCSSINQYNTAIPHVTNQTLRNTLLQLRDEAEQFQSQLYQISEQKGYSIPAQQATQQEIQQTKSSLNQ